MPVSSHPLFRDDDPNHDVRFRPDARLVDRIRDDVEAAGRESDRLGHVLRQRLAHRSGGGIDAPAIGRSASCLAAVARLLDRRADVGAELAEIRAHLAGCRMTRDHAPMLIEAIVESLGEVIGPGFDESSAADWRQTLRLVAALLADPTPPQDRR